MNTPTPYDSTKDTLDHIDAVQGLLKIVRDDLADRSYRHDKSKLGTPEKEAFDELTPKLKGSTYGSDEYKSFLKQLSGPLAHHYAHNDHHPEYFGDYVCVGCNAKWAKTGIPQHCDICFGTEFKHTHDIGAMSLIQLTEMVCDWIAAGRRHADGNIYKSIEINKKRFGYSDEVERILVNTARHILELEQKGKAATQ